MALRFFYKTLHGGKDALYRALLRDTADPVEKKRPGSVLIPI